MFFLLSTRRYFKDSDCSYVSTGVRRLSFVTVHFPLLILHLWDNFTFGFLEAPSIKVSEYQRCPNLSEVPETTSLEMILLAGLAGRALLLPPVVRSRGAAGGQLLASGCCRVPLFGALQFTVMCVAVDFFLFGLLYVPLFSAADFHLSLLLEKLWFLSHPLAIPFHSVINSWEYSFCFFLLLGGSDEALTTSFWVLFFLLRIP